MLSALQPDCFTQRAQRSDDREENYCYVNHNIPHHFDAVCPSRLNYRNTQIEIASQAISCNLNEYLYFYVLTDHLTQLKFKLSLPCR
jgi:hypothetical protein